MLALSFSLVAQLPITSSLVGCTTLIHKNKLSYRPLSERCLHFASRPGVASSNGEHLVSCLPFPASPLNSTISVHQARLRDFSLTSGGYYCRRLFPARRHDRSGAESSRSSYCIWSAGGRSGITGGSLQGGRSYIAFGTSFGGKMTSVSMAPRDTGRQLRQRKETHISLSTQLIGRKKTKGVAHESTSTDDEMEAHRGFEESTATEFEARLWDLDKSNKLTSLTVLELRGYMKMMSKPTAGRKDELISTVKEWLAKREVSTLIKTRQLPSTQETSSDAESLEGALLKAENKNREEQEALSRKLDMPSKEVESRTLAWPKALDIPTVQPDRVKPKGVKMKSGNAQGSARGKLNKAGLELDGTLDEEVTTKVVIKKKNQSANAVKSSDAGLKEQGKKRKLEEQNLSVVEEKVVEIVVQKSKPWLMFAHKKPKSDWVVYDPDTMRPAPPPSGIKTLKLISWNVNGLRALMKDKEKKVQEGLLLLQLAQEEDFDIICLQETKLQEKDVEQIRAAILPAYADTFWSCSTAKLGYSGTAIVSRIKPLSVTYGLGIADHDSEGRVITAEFEKFFLVTCYVPNSGDKLVRLAYRTQEWDPAVSEYLKLLENQKPVVYTGDLNCANEEIDITNPDGNRKSAGFTDEERESFKTNFLDKGLVDTFRRQNPNVVGNTYWGYRSGARAKNAGWRLDYFLVSEGLIDQVHDSYIRPDVGGSDHCPIGLILKE